MWLRCWVNRKSSRVRQSDQKANIDRMQYKLSACPVSDEFFAAYYFMSSPQAVPPRLRCETRLFLLVQTLRGDRDAARLVSTRFEAEIVAIV